MGPRLKCVECGAESAEVAQLCGQCGAPAVGPRLVAAGPAAAGPRDCLVATPAGDAGSPPAWIRRGQPYFMISLIFFLDLYMISVVGLNRTQGPGLHHPMEWLILLSVGGALLSLVLFEAARSQFRVRQPVWALVPILSPGFLAFVPFLWLALIRRPGRGWAVFAAYLAAVATATVISILGTQGAPAALGFLEIAAGLMVIAPVHAVVAFSPAAGASSWREARAATDYGKRQQLVTDGVGPEDLQ
jgi:hypothetical protein